MQDLFTRRRKLEEIIQTDLEEFRNAGIQHAENESEYRRLLRIAILEQREKGTPATVTSDICKGQPNVADARLRRDVSEVLRDASREALLVHKKMLAIVQSDIEREWSQL